MAVNKKKQILFLSPFFDLATPRAIRTENISKALAEKYDITILCFKTTKSIKHEEKYNILRLDFCKLNYYITNKTYSGFKPKGLVRFFSRGMSYLLNRFFISPDPWILEKKSILESISKKELNFDIIICSMVPFSMGKIGSFLKRKLFQDSLLIFDIGDPLAKNSASNYKEITYKRLKKFEQELLNIADHIIVTNRNTQSHYISDYYIEPSKVSIIEQGVNVNLNLQSEVIVKPEDSPIKIVYGGAFYPELRDPRCFFDSFVNLSNFELDIFGDHLPIFKEGFEHVNFFGRVDQNLLLDAYKKADCLLFVDNKFGMQTSGKIFELLALKKPIIFLFSNIDSDVYKMAQEYDHILFLKNEMILNGYQIQSIVDFVSKDFNFEYSVDQFSWVGRAKKLDDIITKRLAQKSKKIT